MKTFKDTEYGDLTGQTYDGSILIRNMGLDSLQGAPKHIKGSIKLSNNNFVDLKGSPEIVDGNFDIQVNKRLVSFEGAPTSIGGTFNCYGTDNVKNQLEQIIMYRIKAHYYYTNDGDYYFEDIADKFNAYDNRVKSKGFRTLLGLKK